MYKIWNVYKNLPIVTKATVWFFICSIIQKAVGLITTPIFTRLLTVEQYGLFSTYNSWLSIFLIFTTFKLNYGVFNKGMSKFSNNRDTYVSTMQVLTTVLTTFFLIFYLLFHEVINRFTGLSTFIILVMIFQLYFEPAISFWSLKKRYEFKYLSVVIVTIVLTILNTFFGIIAVVLTTEKGLSRIVSYALVQAMIGIIIYIINFIKADERFNVKQAIFAIKFNIPLIPHYLSEYVLDQSDKIMIQKIASKAALGLYSIGYSVGMVMKIVISSLNSSLIPWIYNKLEALDFDLINKYLLSVYYFLSFTLILFMVLAPEIIYLLASKEYQEAVYVIPPITANVFFIFLFGMYGNIEFYYDQNKFTMYISIICATLNIVLNLVFIKLFGYIAAAYTSLVCYNILCLGHAVFLEYIFKDIYNRKLFQERKILFISLMIDTSTIFISLLYKNIFLRYFLLIIFAIMSYKKRNTIISILKTFKAN